MQNEFCTARLKALTVFVRAEKEFDVKNFLEKYNKSRFSIYQNFNQDRDFGDLENLKNKDVYIIVVFKYKDATKKSLIEYLSANKKVITHHFYKTWKEIKHDFEKDDNFSLVEDNNSITFFSFQEPPVFQTWRGKEL